ncbi:hypothetical protein [Rubellimicrobium mesophilum]|uniref:hypothetical protein n=1 Tax=Rubellimicrobium mesophilum TaxID=1123067 RepID=UPI0005646383|nr:hypothetical protein [Rubellimicrobium mesophilum]
MSLRLDRTLLVGLLLGGGLSTPAQVLAQEAEPITSRVELVLLQEDGQLKAFSLSTGSGAHVETQSFTSDGGIATGVTVSTDVMALDADESEPGLYTSDVGTLIQGNGRDPAS